MIPIGERHFRQALVNSSSTIIVNGIIKGCATNVSSASIRRMAPDAFAGVLGSVGY